MIVVTLAKPCFILQSQSVNFKLSLRALQKAVVLGRNFRKAGQGELLVAN